MHWTETETDVFDHLASMYVKLDHPEQLVSKMSTISSLLKLLLIAFKIAIGVRALSSQYGKQANFSGYKYVQNQSLRKYRKS